MRPGLDRALQAVAKPAGRLVNPHAAVDEEALRRTVAGKIVLVTGASYGLGEATARRLAGAGATVLLVARTVERLEALAAEIEAAGGNAEAHPTDLTNPDSVDALLADVLARHGHVDVLVNNAGKSIRRSIELSLDRPRDFERTMEINYTGPVRLLLGLVRPMRENGGGHIVNVSTIGTRIAPGPRWAAYQASKGAFDTFFRSVAIELAPMGITTTSLYMALIFTRMSAPTPIFRYLPGQTPEEAAELVAASIVDRPRMIAPWWSGVANVATTAGRRPWEALVGLLFRASRDTGAAEARSRDERKGRPSDRPAG